MTTPVSGTPYSRTACEALPTLEATDGELLARWTAAADPAAMDVLVRRHGAMVLGVCRRLLGNNSDAEDAFQVTFLVLVGKARTLTHPGQVAGWLHGVALRVSRRMRANLARRRQREEAMTSDHPAPVPPEDAGEMRRIIDAELDRLPDKYRLPIVLCELEGLILDQAARRLGWPKGTVAGRLSRGRDILRRRLSRRRGLFMPMMVLAAPGLPGLPGLEGTTGELPDALVSATVAEAGNPAGPTAQTAAAVAAAMGKDAATRKWLLYGIAILFAICLSLTGFQARAALAGSTEAEQPQPPENPMCGCH